MLVTTIEQIKKFLPVTASFEMEDIEPFIQAAEDDDLIHYLGDELFASLDKAVTQNELDENQEALLNKILRPLINIAYYNYIPFGNVTIGKGHISVATNDGIAIASQWRIDELQNTCLNGYFKGIEQMLIYLEKKKDIFTTWADSEAFTEFAGWFIKTASEFDEHFKINNSRMIFLQMKGIMKAMELDHIRTVTGRDLFDDIKGAIIAGNVSDKLEALLEFIRPCVANFTGAAAIQRLPVRWTANGIQLISTISKADNSREAKSLIGADLHELRAASLREAEKQKKNLADHLYKNHGDYPLYEDDPTVYIKTSLSDRAADDNSSVAFF